MRWITVGPPNQPTTSIVLHPPAADPGITDDERRTIAEMMAKGTYAIITLATVDLDDTFERLQLAVSRSSRNRPSGRTASATEPSAIRRRSTTTRKATHAKSESPADLIDARIKELTDWRGDTLARLRKLIKQADPDIVEEWKWSGVPVWEHDGMICTGETYKDVVKVTFAKGASVEDQTGLFNSSLDGNTRRAIDFREDDELRDEAFTALIRAAVELNTR